jgi:hypothetical protein
MKPDALVAKWRADHKDELDKTLNVLISLRDDVNESAKNRIDAGRSIARMLGSLAPEREEDKKAAPVKPVIKSKVEDDLEELLARI